MTNWSEVRKSTSFDNPLNWFNLRLNNEAVLDRAKTFIWTNSIDLGEMCSFFRPVSNKISDYFSRYAQISPYCCSIYYFSQVKTPVQYDSGEFLTLDEQIQQKAKTGQLPIGRLPPKKEA